MPTHIGIHVRISPAVWPGAAGTDAAEPEVQPGNLDLWLPQGIGLDVPPVFMPWDDLESVMNRGNYYGLQSTTRHPILDAPRTGAAGGVVYFRGDPPTDEVAALLALLEVQTRNRHYAVFLAEATSPERENFLTQVRIVSRFALKYAFGVLSNADYEAFPEQPLDVGELIARFLADQQEIYGTGYSDGLRGAMGGDGDWAKETLAFGFAVENEYQGVYRLWSRAWLVTK